MKKVSALLAVSALIASTSLALAEDGAKGDHPAREHGGVMARADANKDGKITLAEALAGGNQMFDRKDANKDGAIAKDEVKARGQRWFERADANKDGKVTRAEAETLVREMFTRRDKNKDGVLTQDELRGPGRGGHGHHASRGNQHQKT